MKQIILFVFIYLLHFYCTVSNMYKISFDGEIVDHVDLTEDWRVCRWGKSLLTMLISLKIEGPAGKANHCWPCWSHWRLKGLQVRQVIVDSKNNLQSPYFLRNYAMAPKNNLQSPYFFSDWKQTYSYQGQTFLVLCFEMCGLFLRCVNCFCNVWIVFEMCELFLKCVDCF